MRSENEAFGDPLIQCILKIFILANNIFADLRLPLDRRIFGAR
jgi:hypothetical protein